MNYDELSNLVKSAASGTEQAFEQLCREKMGSILYHISRLIDNPCDVEDVAQNVTLKMYQNIKNLRNPRLFNAWLQSIIMNECKMALRKRNKSFPILIAEDSDVFEVEEKTEFLPAAYVEDKEKREELLNIIEELPPKRKSILLMYYYEDLSAAEIAQITKTSIGSVTSSLTKAKKAILSELRKRDDGMPPVMAGMVAAPVLKLVFESHVQCLFPRTVICEVMSGCAAKIQAAKIAADAAVMTSAGTAGELIGKVKIAGGALASAAVLTSGILVAHYVTSNNYATVCSYPSPPPSAITTGTPQTDGLVAEGPFTIAGVVRIIDQQGKIVTDTDVDITGVALTLYGPNNFIAGPVAVAADGSFSLTGADLYLTETYTVQISFSDEHGFSFCGRTPAGRHDFVGQDAQGLELFCTVRKTPAVELAVVGGACDCGHVNPQTLQAQSTDCRRLCEGSWIIADRQGNILYSGQGTEITGALQAMLEQSQDGDYTVTLVCEDEFGNSAALKYDFTIYSGPIESNQYA